MSVLSQLHFVRPLWFLALLPLGLLIWYLARKRLTANSWRKACDTHLLPFILTHEPSTESRHFLYWAGIAGTIAVVSLAGPAWERLPQPVLRDDSGLVITLDLSQSMVAVDLEPSRITRARFKIDDFLARRQGGQVALLVYSNQAFPVVPLTHDIASVRTFLQSVDTDLMPGQGSRPDVALREAGELIHRAGLEQGKILLVTDFADKPAIAEAKRLARENFQIAVLGAGTLQGAPIFLPSGNLLEDNGKTVIPQLREKELQLLATAGQGVYRRLDSVQNSDVNTLLEWEQAPLFTNADTSQSSRMTEAWREQGAWLILLLLPLVLLCFRRGVLIVAGAFFLMPLTGEAFEWQNLWLKPDQRGVRLLDKGDAGAAAQAFKDPRWKSVAQYRNRDFAASAKTIASLQEADDFYNRGNAFAVAGDLQAALNAYDQALAIDQKMEDAVYNRRLVERMLRQQQALSQEHGENSEQEPPADAPQTGQNQTDKTSVSNGPSQQSDMKNAAGGQNTDSVSTPPEETASEQHQTLSQEQNENSEQASSADVLHDEQTQANEPSGNSDPSQQNAAKNTAGEENEDSVSAQSNAGSDMSSGLAEGTMDEQQQAIEQLLQRVQDNPRRLLQRKFRQLQQLRSKDAGPGDKNIASW